MVDLRSKRKALGYTTVKVAQLAGITRQYYSYIEHGKNVPSVKVAKKLGEILGFDFYELFT